MKRFFNILFASIWIVNGLFFKVLQFVPRHQTIVSEILELEEAYFLTLVIGVAETILGILILMNWRPKFLALTQVLLILSMNIFEYFLVPQLLMFGKWNLLFAILLCLGILVNQKSRVSLLFSFNNHPFRVNAHFNYCYVFTFSLPIEEVDTLLFKGLVPDTFQDKFAFYTIAIVDTQNLRPSFLPKLFGGNFLLVGHRLFVRLKSKKGKIYRGLQILKSETNSLRMKIIGNMLTHYNYRKQNFEINVSKENIEIKSSKTGFRVLVSKGSENVSLPETSPFSSWKEARKFAGPMPFTFTDLAMENKILVVEGKRDKWEAKPIEVKSIEFPDYSKKLFPNAKLASAFKIENVDYQWQKGQIIEY